MSRGRKVSLPSTFEENRGQFDPAVRFRTRNADGAVLFTRSGPEFQLGRDAVKTRVQMEVIRPAGARLPELSGEQIQPGKVNYFLGNESKASVADAATYARLRYTSYLPGVDLTFYATEHALEHDFVVAPHADPASIRFRLTHAESARVNAQGDIEIVAGGSRMSLRKPVAYQVENGGRVPVAAAFAMDEEGVISFRVGRYQAERELVIDPVLVFSSYLDGNGADTASAITTDSGGNIYLAGSTTSSNFPVVSAYQSSCSSCTSPYSSNQMGYLAKLDPTGSTLLYATYFAGNAQTNIDRIRIDIAGNIVGVGYTASSNFPRVGNYSGSYSSGLFAFSLNATGNVLNHSEIVGSMETSFGGYGSKRLDVAVDSSRNVYITGLTFAYSYLPLQFPVTTGTYGSGKTLLGSGDVLFATKLGADGALLYSTIVPSTTSFTDVSFGNMALDASGNIYLSGTATAGIPTTAGTVSPNFPNNNPGNVAYSGESGFVLALNAQASGLLFSTYLPGTDNANTLARAPDGSLYVAGTTSEPNLPVTAGAYQPALKAGAGCSCDGGYVLRLNATGTQILAATYLSGTNDYNNTLTAYAGTVLSPDGNVFVGGVTAALDHPLMNPIVPFLDITGNQLAGGTILTGLSADLTRLVFSSYFSGDGAGDRLTDMAIDSNSHLLFTGGTYANANFLTTATAYQPNPPPQASPNATYQHQFVASVDLSAAAPALCTSTRSINAGSVQAGASSTSHLVITNCGNAPLTVSSISSSLPAVTATPTVTNLAAGQSYTVQVTFSPIDSTATAGTLTIASNTSLPTQRVSVSGQGVAPVLSTSTSVTLPPMVVGTTPATSTAVLLRSVGNAPLIVSGISATGEFTAANTCVRTLAVNAICGATITFNPTSSGTKQGTVTITSNDPVHPVVTVAVTGTVLDAFSTPSLTSLSQSTFPAGSPAITLIVNGTNFFPQSTAAIHGTPVSATYYGPTSLQITVPAALLTDMAELAVTVSNPAPGGGTSAALPLIVYRALPTAAAGLLFEPVSGKLYASIGAGAATGANTIAVIDPQTGQLQTSITVGRGPNHLAASADGNYLYVSLDTDHAIQRIVLPGGTIDRTFSLPIDAQLQLPTTVADMHVVPGAAQSIVVSLSRAASPGSAGYALFNDAGLVSYLGSSITGDVGYFTFTSDPGTAYSVPYTPGALGVLGVSPSGLTVFSKGGAGILTASDGADLYGSNFLVIDPGSQSQVGSFPPAAASTYASGLAIDAGAKRAYFAGSFSTSGTVVNGIAAFDTNSFQQTSFIPLPTYSLLDLQRWSTDGLALRTSASDNSGQIIIFRSSLVNTTPANAPFISALAPASLLAGAPATTVTITGTGFAADAVALWNGSARATTFVSATTLQVQLTAADLLTAAVGRLTVQNQAANTSSGGYPLPVVGAAISFTPASISFAAQRTTTTSPQQRVTVTNTSGGPLANLALAITGTDATVFAQSSSCTSSLAAGASCTIDVTFTPASTGIKSGALIVTQGGTALPQTLALTGVGAVPTFSLSGTGYNFGTVGVGLSASQGVSILTNTGLLPITNIKVAVAGINGVDFNSIDTYCQTATLPPGSTCSPGITFAPLSLGDKAATVTVSADNATSQQLQVTGHAARVGLAMTPLALTFGDVAVGGLGTRTATLTNTGEIALSGIRATFTDANVPVGFVYGTDCSASQPWVIAPGASCTFTLTFAPNHLGVVQSSLTFGLLPLDGYTSPLLDEVARHLVTFSINGVPTTTLSSSSLDLGAVAVSQTSEKLITLTNTSGVGITLSGAISGTNASDFAYASDCPALIAAAASCTLHIHFTPSSTGQKLATLTLLPPVANQSGSLAYSYVPSVAPQTISLSGQGGIPALTVSPTSVVFGNQLPGQSSTQTVSLTNTSSLAVSSISAVLSGPNASEFSVSVSCGALAVNASCAATVQFQPSSAGNKAAAVTFSSPGIGPQTVSLSGKGATAAFALTPATLSFGSEPVGQTASRSITFTNTGDIALSGIAAYIAGANLSDFSVSTTCTGTIDIGASCSATVQFKPTAPGDRSAVLSFNAAGATSQTAPLGGQGAAAGLTAATLNLAFGTQPVGQASTQSIAFANTGGSSLSGITMAVSGANASDFTVSTTCGSLDTGSSCASTVQFKPGAAGARSAVLTFGATGIASQAVTLSGSGATLSFTLTPGSLTFATQPIGQSSAQVLTLTNTGGLALTGISPAVSGTNASDFLASTTCGSTLGLNASCTVTVQFNPSAAGARSAVLTVAAFGVSSQTISLAGQGGAVAFNVTPSSLSFTSLLVGQTAAQTITISNTGNLALTGVTTLITGANASDFNVSGTCAALGVGASCTAAVQFVPSAAGSRSAVLTIGAGGAASVAVTLAGTGASDFTITPGSGGSGNTTTPTATVTAGQPAAYSLAVTQSASFQGTITMSCSNLPQYSSCAFSPSSFAAGSTQTNVTLTISTQATGSASLDPRGGGHTYEDWGRVSLAMLFGCGLLARKRRPFGGRGMGLFSLALCLMGGSLVLSLSGCGASPSGAATSNPAATKTAPGTYVVQVVATSGTTSHSQSVTLVVQ